MTKRERETEKEVGGEVVGWGEWDKQRKSERDIYRREKEKMQTEIQMDLIEMGKDRKTQT